MDPVEKGTGDSTPEGVSHDVPTVTGGADVKGDQPIEGEIMPPEYVDPICAICDEPVEYVAVDLNLPEGLRLVHWHCIEAQDEALARAEADSVNFAEHAGA